MNNQPNREYMWASLKAYSDLLLSNHPWRAIVSLLHTISNIGLTVLIPYIISMALSDIILENNDLFWKHMIALSITAVMVIIFNAIGFTTGIRLAARLERLATNKAFEHFLYRSVSFHTNNFSGKLATNAIEYGKNASRVLFDLVFNGLLPYVLSSIIGIGIVFTHSLEIGLALTFVYVMTISLTLIDSRRRSSLRIMRKRLQDSAVANVADVITNAQATITFARELDEQEKNDQLQSELLKYRIRDWGATSISGSIRLGALLILQILFIIYISMQIRSNPEFLGVGIYAFTYTLSMVGKLFELGQLFRVGEEAMLSASTMTKYLLERPEITDSADAIDLKIDGGSIDFKDMSFAYPDNPSEYIFENFSLSIPAGQKVGLVGRSGGGKTSLTKLILRFEDVASGQILIDDSDIRKITQKSLREAVGYVPQEPLLFHRSVRENIAYGKPDAEESEIIEVARKAYAYDFITSLPDGLDTIVGERGVKLSGGQRQRIAIARAMLKDAPILILDEATSALDSESEVFIQKALSHLMQGRTSIVIAHRLSTIAKLDRIIVLDNGKVIEDGAHDELIAQNGTYAKLWKHQSGGFIAE